MNRLLIYAIAGWSGFFVMAVELLSGRLLAPNFGSTIQVLGSIITVFMLALSLGYLVGGRLSVTEPSIAKLSLIMMAAAVATVPAVVAGDAVTERIFAHILDPRYGALTASMALFFLPTLFGGMVSPYAVRLLVDECRLSGHQAGSLYFVSTFGSGAGTLLTSFYLVLILDLYQIFWSLIAVSLTLGLLTLTFALSRMNTDNPEHDGL